MFPVDLFTQCLLILIVMIIIKYEKVKQNLFILFIFIFLNYKELVIQNNAFKFGPVMNHMEKKKVTFRIIQIK